MMKTRSLTPSRKALLPLCVLTAGFLASPAYAQLYWDTNGDTAGAATGGVADGTWDTSTANWNTAADGGAGTGGPGNYVTGSDVVFSAGSDTTSATITLGSNQTVNTMTFNGGTVVINNITTQQISGASSGTTHITVASGANVSINAITNLNGTFTVNGTLYGKDFRGGAATVKTGTGTATFDRFDASLTINQGTVVVQGGGKLKNTTVNATGKLRIAGDAFEGTNRNLTVNAGGQVEVAAGISDSVNSLGGTGEIIGEIGSELTMNSGTFGGTISGDLALSKIGSGNFNFNGTSTSTGNFSVDAGTTTFGTTSTLTFFIGADGVNNMVDGVGTANFNGTFVFNLDAAAAGGTWTIVSDTLTASYGSGFTVSGFSNNGDGTWTKGIYTFDQASGALSAIPEPSTYALLAGLGVLGLVIRRKLRASRTV